MPLFFAPSIAVIVACLTLGCGSDVYEGDLQVRDMDDVERVADLSSVVGAIVVAGDPTTIAWPKLTSVTGRLVIRDQAALEVLDLSGLTSVGMLILERNPRLTTIRLPNLRSAGWLVITDCAPTSLELPALTHVDSLTISNVRLEALALPALERLGAGTHSPPSLIRHNVLLTSLQLPRLGAIEAGATLMIEHNASLTTLDLPSLTTLHGGLTVANNVALRTVRLEVLAQVAESSLFSIGGSPALVRVHVPVLGAAARRNVSLATSPWAEPKPFVPRGGLQQAAVSPAGVTLLGYDTAEGALFEAHERTGKIRWHTTVRNQRSTRSVLWTQPTLVPPSASAAYFTAPIGSGTQDDKLYEVVGLATDTGAVSWREPGTRSWAADGLTVVLRPRAADGMFDDVGRIVGLSDARLADPSTAETRIGDGQAAAYDLLEAGDRRFLVTTDARNNVIAMDASGVIGRMTSRIQDTVIDDAGRVLIVCDPTNNERSSFDDSVEPDHVLACQDLGAEDAPIPPALHAMATPFLHLAPKSTPYLALSDGRSAPRPLRLGPAVIAPLGHVVPLALLGDRLVLAVPGDQRADVYVLTLGDAPTITRVEGLDGTPYNASSYWDFLPLKPLGRHLPLVFRRADGPRLHLLDITTARVDLTLPITRDGDFLNTRPRAPWSDGLLAFDLRIDLIGNAMVWIEAHDPRPAVVAAYQLRDAQGVVLHEVSAAPRQAYFYPSSNAFGAGLHVASISRGNASAAVIIDIRERRIVWSDDPTIRLVDMTDVVAERWSQAWAR